MAMQTILSLSAATSDQQPKYNGPQAYIWGELTVNSRKTKGKHWGKQTAITVLSYANEDCFRKHNRTTIECSLTSLKMLMKSGRLQRVLRVTTDLCSWGGTGKLIRETDIHFITLGGISIYQFANLYLISHCVIMLMEPIVSISICCSLERQLVASTDHRQTIWMFIVHRKICRNVLIDRSLRRRCTSDWCSHSHLHDCPSIDKEALEECSSAGFICLLTWLCTDQLIVCLPFPFHFLSFPSGTLTGRVLVGQSASHYHKLTSVSVDGCE